MSKRAVARNSAPIEEDDSSDISHLLLSLLGGALIIIIIIIIDAQCKTIRIYIYIYILAAREHLPLRLSVAHSAIDHPPLGHLLLLYILVYVV